MSSLTRTHIAALLFASLAINGVYLGQTIQTHVNAKADHARQLAISPLMRKERSASVTFWYVHGKCAEMYVTKYKNAQGATEERIRAVNEVPCQTMPYVDYSTEAP